MMGFQMVFERQPNQKKRKALRRGSIHHQAGLAPSSAHCWKQWMSNRLRRLCGSWLLLPQNHPAKWGLRHTGALPRASCKACDFGDSKNAQNSGTRGNTRHCLPTVPRVVIPRVRLNPTSEALSYFEAAGFATEFWLLRLLLHTLQGYYNSLTRCYNLL